MWLTKWSGVFVLPALATIAIGGGWLLWSVATEGAHLNPDRREVVVREVENGFIVAYRMANTPYPIREAIAKDANEAALLLRDYLQQPLHKTGWGK